MPKNNKRVTFCDNNTINIYTSNQTHIYKKISKNIKINRCLRKIEKYMTSVDLLFKNEHLKLTKNNHEHIRGNYIDFIARKYKWINKRRHLKIITD